MDSTNTQAKILGESGGDNGTVVIAELQTAGKGRRCDDYSKYAYAR